MTKPADHRARTIALNTRQSFAVAAPAGSGKTGLLTQRILCLLAEVETPEQILCMTFTRKAAGEMRHRLINALINAQNDHEPKDPYQHATWTLARRVLARDKALNWQLIAAPNRLRILTIDSFCRNLAAQLVLESGFGELPEPVDNADKFYRLAVHELLSELEANSALGDSLGTLLIHFDNDMARLEGLLLRLLSKREQWLPHIFSSLRTSPDDVKTRLEQAAQDLIEETLYQATEHLGPRASDIAMLADYGAQHLQADSPDSALAQCLGMDELPETTALELPRWLGLVDMLLTQKGEWRKSITKKVGFPTKKDSLYPDLAGSRKEAWTEFCQWCQQQTGLLEALNDIRHLPAAEFGQEQWQVLEALTQILPQLSAYLNLTFRSEGVCDYTEITLAALTALGEEDNPTELTLRLDHQIRHILVDEFQDTSTMHFDMLRRLTAGWQNDDGRTLFFVGDGMQSLYSFRNANVGLFMDIRQHAFGDINLEPLDLNVNFRSQANIINWVNRLFSGAFPPVDNRGRGAVAYSPSAPFKAALQGPAVHLDIFDDDAERWLEAEQVAQIILEARANKPLTSIAILVRGRAHLREILPALREHELSWQATDIDPLASCMPVIDLMSLTRAMLNPADRIAWLAILRAPWCGLSLVDLHHVANAPVAGNPTPNHENYPLLLQQIFAYGEIDALSNDGRQILSRVARTLSTAWQQRSRKPLRVWLEGLWIALGGAAALAGAQAGTQINDQSLGQCRQYWDLLESHARDGGKLSDWAAFESAVDKLYAEPAPTISGTEEIPAPIQIMTIHKAKGLEFDTVILPGLDRRTRGADAELLRWRERVDATGQTQLLMSPPQKLGGDSDPTFEHLKREEGLKNRLENTRVLYVACTRAIKHLHLLFKQPAKAPGSNSLLAALWPTLEKELEPEKLEQPGSDCQITRHSAPSEQLRTTTDLGAEAATDTDTEDDNIQRFQWRLSPDWQSPSCYDTQQIDELIEDQQNASVETPAPDFGFLGGEPEQSNDVHSDARKTGILFHRTLQYLVADGLPHWDAQRIAQQGLIWQRQSQELGLSNTDAAIATMMTALNICLEDIRNAWIFDNHHEDSTCELALGYMDSQGKARTAVVDRSFILNGERWIIDYKLSNLDGHETGDTPLTLDNFIAQQKRQYRPQLKHYAQLFSQLSARPNQPGTGSATNLVIKAALYFPLYGRLELVDIE